MDSITIEDLDYTGLQKTVWRFWIDGFKFVVDNYAIYTRETKRKGWNRVGWYERIDGRTNTLERPEFIPAHIQKAVMVKLLDSIEFRVGM